MAIDLVIFDCDGVLVDSEPITTRLLIDHARRLGLELDVEDALLRWKGGRLADVVAEIEERLGRSVPETFALDFRAELVVRMAEEVQAVPGILDVLDQLTYPACVASNGPRAKMNASLGATGMLERFEGRIFSAYEVGTFKPEPGLFLHAAEALGALPSRCVVIEDSVGGVTAGIAAGMAVYAYATDEHGEAMADAGATLFHAMAELPALLGSHAAS
ncbi:MAG: HAD-IA family hydrolase [Planctomycetota bacterium]|nr:HAD-IA family hydrolase [Planctomycetota bacterium]